MNMTLTELRYLIKLAEEQHFGRAAEKASVSQPTLSIAIKKLEESLGVSLFERDRHHIRLTPTGARVVKQARIVLSGVDELSKIAKHDQNELSIPLRLGAIYTVGPYLYPTLVRYIQQEEIPLALYMEENFTHKLQERLLAGELDAIIVAEPFELAGVVTTPVYEESFVVLMPPNHALAHKKAIDVEQLSDYPVLVLGKGHCFGDQVFAFCPYIDPEKAEHALGAKIESTSLETVRHMVSAGMGIAVMPESAVQGIDKTLLTIRPFKGNQPSRRLVLAWRKTFPREKTITLLDYVLRDCKLSGTTPLLVDKE